MEVYAIHNWPISEKKPKEKFIGGKHGRPAGTDVQRVIERILEKGMNGGLHALKNEIER